MSTTLESTESTGIDPAEIQLLQADAQTLIDDELELQAMLLRVADGKSLPSDLKKLNELGMESGSRKRTEAVARAETIRREQRKAGRPDEYDAARQRSEVAQQELADTLAKSEPQMEKLRRQLATLQATVDQAEAKERDATAEVTLMDAAREKLERMTPDTLKATLKMLQKRFALSLVGRAKYDHLSKMNSLAERIGQVTPAEYAKRLGQHGRNTEDSDRPSAEAQLREVQQGREDWIELWRQVEREMEPFGELKSLYLLKE